MASPTRTADEAAVQAPIEAPLAATAACQLPGTPTKRTTSLHHVPCDHPEQLQPRPRVHAGVDPASRSGHQKQGDPTASSPAASAAGTVSLDTDLDTSTSVLTVPVSVRNCEVGGDLDDSSAEDATAKTRAASAAKAEQDARAAAASEWRAKTVHDPFFQSRQDVSGKLATDRWSLYGGRSIDRLLATAALVDAEYLIALSRRGGILPRGQDLPQSARIDKETTWRLQRWEGAFSLPVVVLSYPWLSVEHPDPAGVQLRAVAPVLEAMVDAAKTTGRHATVGVMIDFCSLPQHPYSDDDRAVFERGLSEMHAWYSHPFTHTLLLTSVPGMDAENAPERQYAQRGWCYFELRTASLVKNADLLWDMANWSGQKDYAELRSSMIVGREPPASPPRVEAEMRRRIGDGSLSFSYAHDVEPVIAMYRRGFLAAFESYRELRCIEKGNMTSIFYGNLGWGDAEAFVLAEAVAYVNEHCTLADGPIEVTVTGNHIQEAGQKALGGFFTGKATYTMPEKLYVTGLALQFSLPAPSREFRQMAIRARTGRGGRGRGMISDRGRGGRGRSTDFGSRASSTSDKTNPS